MKKYFVLIFTFIISLLCLSACDNNLFKEPVDQIELYNITVDQRADGTLDLEYEIEWYVVEDAGEKLTWIAIGIPNGYVDTIKGITDNIKNIGYSDDSGDFIHVDFTKSYAKGDKFTFAFSYHLNRLYTFDDNTVTYEFTPGWFDDIEVKSITVRWNNNNVKSANGSNDGAYYVWHSSLKKGEKLDEIVVTYNRSDFPNLITEKAKEDNEGLFIIIFIAVCLAVLFIIIVVGALSDDGYYTYRGFVGDDFYFHYYLYHHFWYFHHRPGINRRGETITNPKVPTSSGHSSGGHCACACACACAGGGRAGCARKDFYNPNLDANEFVNKLRNYK